MKIMLAILILAGLSACGKTRTTDRWGSGSVDVMMRELEDYDCTVREKAARALGRMGCEAEKAVPALCRCAEEDEVALVREAAGHAVSLIQGNAPVLMARTKQ